MLRKPNRVVAASRAILLRNKDTRTYIMGQRQNVGKDKNAEESLALPKKGISGPGIFSFLSWFQPFYLLRLLGLSVISRYIVAEFFFSFAISFAFFFFSFLVNALLLVARKYAGEGLPLTAILRLIYYNTPSNISLSLPFSLLVGAMMTIGHLAASNQMMAFRSCGVRRMNLILPLLFCSLLVALGSFIFNDYFLPLGRINTRKLTLQLLSNNPKVILNSYSVRTFRTENGRNTYIVSGLVESGIINDLIIVDYDEDANRRIFFAKRARLADDRPSGVVPFVLEDVNATIASNFELQKYSYIKADSLLYNVLLGDVTETYRLGPDDRQTLDLIELLQEAQSQDRILSREYEQRSIEYMNDYRSVYRSFYMTTDASITKDRIKDAYNTVINRPKGFYNAEAFSYKMALYLRMAVPFSCIPFMVLAFGLGSMARRYGRTIGFLLGLALSGIFYFSLAGGRLLGVNTDMAIPPFLLMFASNILFLSLGLLLLLRQRG